MRQDANPDHWQGSELSVTILGSWQYYRAKVRAGMASGGSMRLLAQQDSQAGCSLPARARQTITSMQEPIAANMTRTAYSDRQS